MFEKIKKQAKAEAYDEILILVNTLLSTANRHRDDEISYLLNALSEKRYSVSNVSLFDIGGCSERIETLEFLKRRLEKDRDFLKQD